MFSEEKHKDVTLHQSSRGNTLQFLPPESIVLLCFQPLRIHDPLRPLAGPLRPFQVHFVLCYSSLPPLHIPFVPCRFAAGPLRPLQDSFRKSIDLLCFQPLRIYNLLCQLQIPFVTCWSSSPLANFVYLQGYVL